MLIQFDVRSDASLNVTELQRKTPIREILFQDGLLCVMVVFSLFGWSYFYYVVFFIVQPLFSCYLFTSFVSPALSFSVVGGFDLFPFLSMFAVLHYCVFMFPTFFLPNL